MDGLVCAVKDVEQDWLQKIWSLFHVLEIEGLDTGESERVLRVVKDVAILPALQPS